MHVFNVHFILHFQRGSLCLLCGWPPPVQRPSVFLSPKNKLQIFYGGRGEDLGVQLLPIVSNILPFSVTSSPSFLAVSLMLPNSGSLAVLLCKKLSCFLAFLTAISVGIHVSQAGQVSGFSYRCFPGFYTLLLSSFLLSL